MSTRPAAIAGSFYPDNPSKLQSIINSLIEVAPDEAEFTSPPKAIIVPHAGYQYSGVTAACAYKTLQPFADRLNRVVLMGPCHRVSISGAALPTHTAFATPLGTTPLDVESMKILAQHKQAGWSDVAHRNEHSLEVHLPFLQTIIPSFTLIPITVGRITPSDLADILEQLNIDDQTLFVVSTDLSHFHTAQEARSLDTEAIEWISQGDTTHLTHDHACGATVVKGFLSFAGKHGWQRPTFLHRSHSGEVTGDNERVVGYASWAVTNTIASDNRTDERTISQNTSNANSPKQSMGDQLITLARSTIEATLRGERFVPDTQKLHPELLKDGACFVTLNTNRHDHEPLRGCIGTLTAFQPLYKDCMSNAYNAALHDPRFKPLTLEEWPSISIDISVLSSPVLLHVSSRLELEERLVKDRDGVIIASGSHRATFLPSVWEALPSAEVFINRLLQKAGLPSNTWPSDIKVYTYYTDYYTE